jgi:hypothetical protein
MIAKADSECLILWPQNTPKKGLNVAQMLLQKFFLARRSIDQQAERERKLRFARKQFYLLRDAVFVYREIVLAQPVDEVSPASRALKVSVTR